MLTGDLRCCVVPRTSTHAAPQQPELLSAQQGSRLCTPHNTTPTDTTRHVVRACPWPVTAATGLAQQRPHQQTLLHPQQTLLQPLQPSEAADLNKPQRCTPSLTQPVHKHTHTGPSVRLT